MNDRPGPQDNELPAWMADDLQSRRDRGLYRQRRLLQSGQGVRVRLGGRVLVNFSSNDYLDLATDPRLARAACRAALRYGCGAGASPLVSGHLPPHRALERALAHWEQTEAALVFSSGYAANLALVSTLTGRGDAIFGDAFNHASLIDGCRLSRATTYVYKHGDLDCLADLLKDRAASARRRLIVTDTVFSMDGDFAPLQGILELAERYDALVLADEAHATGVVGEEGRGITDYLPAATRGRHRLIKVGTLSKALGSQGGFVCGPRMLIAWLVNQARPYGFSTALTVPAAAAARRAVALAGAEPDRRRRVLGLAGRFRELVQGIGYQVGPSRCQIVPLIVGEARVATRLSRRLERAGLLVPAIRPPSVPEATARLRVTLTAGHTDADVDRLVDSLAELRVGTTV